MVEQKHREKKPSKLHGTNYVERTDCAKLDGEVLVEKFKASRSVKVMGVISACNTRTA